MFLRRKGCFASSAFKIGVAAEFSYEDEHKGFILAGQHLLLHTGESSGIGDRFVVPIEAAGGVPAASAWIEQGQVIILLQHGGVGCLVEAGACLGTGVVLADGIAGRKGGVEFLRHIVLSILREVVFAYACKFIKKSLTLMSLVPEIWIIFVETG